MSIVKELTRELSEYQAAQRTAGALEDISGLRVQNIRRQFDKNRAFFEEIRALYGVVQSHAKKRDIETLEKPKRPKTLFVAITSNKRFYGALIRDIVAELMRRLVQEADASSVIIGRVGWQYLEQAGATKRTRQIVLNDDTPTTAEFQELLKLFEGYNRIWMLYPKFINPFKQDVGIEDITQSPQTEVPQTNVGYIFEPEIPALLSFFDTQVRRVLFNRVLLEAELARTSARFMRMEEAGERTHTLLGQTSQRLRREEAALSNMELLETFAGFSKWHQM
jgi:ATP synthase F1 gamma subunit